SSIDEAEAGIIRNQHDVQRCRSLVRQLYGNKARLSMPVAPRRHGVQASEVVVERTIEIQNGFLVVVAMDLLLVSVEDRDQKIRGSSKGLPASIEDPYLQPACRCTHLLFHLLPHGTA